MVDDVASYPISEFRSIQRVMPIDEPKMGGMR